MDLSIVIVNWNTCKILADCLSSIYKHTSQISYEVIVVDNASTDDSVEMLRRRFPSVGVIANAENRGFASANNQGMAAATGRYVLLLNSDTLLFDNAIAKALAFADAVPRAAVVGCRILNKDGSLQRSCFLFPSVANMLLSASFLYKLLPESKFFGRERMTWWRFDQVRRVDVVMGCFMLVRRTAIEEVGMMDDRFFMYAEETDWCYRFKQAGWQVYFTPEPAIIHLGGQSSAKVRDSMIIQLRLSILKFIAKHYGAVSYSVASALVAVFFALRLPYWNAVEVLNKGRSDQARVISRAYFRGMMLALGIGAYDQHP